MCFVCVCAGRNAGDHPGHIEYSGRQFVSDANRMVDVRFLELTDEAATLVEGLTWGGQIGAAATITYTFDIGSINSELVFADNVVAFDSAQQTATLGVFDKLAAITNLTFNEASNPGSADISFYIGDIEFDNTVGITGFTGFGDALNEAAVGIDSGFDGITQVGSFDYTTLLHEIGHAIGLKHPGNYGSSDVAPFLDEEDDNTGNTVMSYNDDDGSLLTNPSNYQQFDIEALQYLYGELDSSTPTDPDPTDPGDDTVDASQGIGNVANFISQIEVTGIAGTDGSDVLLADINGSELFGGLGTDSVYGYNGNDTLYGGQSIADSADSEDEVMGGAGSDLIYGNAGNDTIYGAYEGVTAGDGADTIYGGFGQDSIYGNLGNDYLAGGGGVAHPDDEADQIYGGYGDDSILGNGGDDTIVASFGNDTIWGGYGADNIDGGDGNDFIVGQFGDETLTGGNGTDIFYFSGSDGNDVITDFAINDILQLRIGMNGSNFDTKAEALSLIAFSGDNAVLYFNPSASITFTGVTEGEIGLSNIELV